MYLINWRDFNSRAFSSWIQFHRRFSAFSAVLARRNHRIAKKGFQKWHQQTQDRLVSVAMFHKRWNYINVCFKCLQKWKRAYWMRTKGVRTQVLLKKYFLYIKIYNNNNRNNTMLVFGDDL